MKENNEMIPSDDVYALLHALNVPQELYGYRYLALTVQLAADDPDGSVNELLARVSEAYSTSVGSVESAMRKAIADSWSHGGDIAFRAKVFGNIVQFTRGKPSLREYIAQTAGYLRIKRSGLL